MKKKLLKYYYSHRYRKDIGLFLTLVQNFPMLPVFLLIEISSDYTKKPKAYFDNIFSICLYCGYLKKNTIEDKMDSAILEAKEILSQV